ncbi:DNA polymerase III subunit delta' [Carnobacteriaceae bacterium zg-84]|uniref:DNA polymerase III subunit delta' n=1 Tax=Granulicatella sp. zg-84 TaxID=2678503 RepID=UPI0013C1EBA9|nr:DNA polymerase III subunit delta' [Granulicatella sp. zg-84]NEW65620.1 DNA polymerase III subunit delta' [Granulicatella sp. zg-84]QMI85739.1 DNA polymerase III subunit delta' [Carnobacteriaceae bacterium zg-84]
MMIAYDKQPHIRQRLLQAYHKDKLAHAYLFYGKSGVGKLEVAKWFAKLLFCKQVGETGACVTCSVCKRIDLGDFPDVDIIQPDGASIKVEQVRQLKESTHYSSLENKRKVYILNHVDTMSISAANSLLKFLEEPEQDIYFLLLTEHKDKVLQTIQSRCQLIPFVSISSTIIEKDLIDRSVPSHLAKWISLLTQDSQQALEWAESDTFFEFHQAMLHWAKLLYENDVTSFVYVQTTLAPFIQDKALAFVGLDIVSLYMRDVMLSAFDVSNVHFKHKSMGHQEGFSTKDMFLFIAKAKERLYANVSAQVCYETLSIDIVRL